MAVVESFQVPRHSDFLLPGISHTASLMLNVENVIGSLGTEVRGLLSRSVADAGAKLVMVDNLYMYGPGQTTMTEYLQERGGSKKGRDRVEMARMLRDAYDSGRIRRRARRGN